MLKALRRMPAGHQTRSHPAVTRAAVVVAVALLATMVCAGAAAASTLPGGPLTVSVGPLGQCQSAYASTGNNFYPASGALGDCGFIIGFPEAGNPAFVQKKVFGFQGIQGPRLASQYTAVSQGGVTGSGSPADPYQVITTFKVSDAAKAKENDYAVVEGTTRYVNGEPQFTSTFNVENVTGESIPGLSPAPATPLRFHAIFAGDLLTGDSDFGSGVLFAGPPREIGGVNGATGVLGGFVEAPPPSPPWSDYQAGCWDVVPEIEGRCPATSTADGGIWAAVRGAGDQAPVFNSDIDPNLIDIAAGVSWDDHLNNALKPGEHAIYTIIDRAQIPSALTIQPATQIRTVGQIATVTVTATDNAGAPYANRPIVYSIGATNPKLGSVLTNPSGVATISYVGTAAGLDAAQVFLDLPGTGTRASRDPSSTAQIEWTPPAPTSRSPNSGYRIRSIHSSKAGEITIIFVPVQDGTATLEVTVPTATISRKEAIAAKKTRCKRNQIRIGGNCRRKTTVSGKRSAKGKAGVALKLVVKPSSKVANALRRGRKVQLTAKLTYKSKLGGKPTARTFHVTVKGAKRKKKH